MAKKATLEDFIKKAKLVHGNKYDYSKVEYVNNNTKVTIVCPIHGEFEQLPRIHTRSTKSNQGCPVCSGKIVSTSEEFIEKVNKVHNNKYSYDKVEYKNSSTKVIITCPIHGNWEQTPDNHLQGRGCPSCAKKGFDQNKPGILYYLKITTDNNKVLYKIGITNRSVNERFELKDLKKIEIVKQFEFEIGTAALNLETEIKRKYKKYKYKGPPVLQDGNSELFTKDVLALHKEEN